VAKGIEFLAKKEAREGEIYLHAGKIQDLPTIQTNHNYLAKEKNI
jgi:hypothetical protein